MSIVWLKFDKHVKVKLFYLPKLDNGPFPIFFNFDGSFDDENLFFILCLRFHLCYFFSFAGSTELKTTHVQIVWNPGTYFIMAWHCAVIESSREIIQYWPWMSTTTSGRSEIFSITCKHMYFLLRLQHKLVHKY